MSDHDDDMKRALFVLSAFLSACSGGGGTTQAPIPDICSIPGVQFSDPMTQPAAGATGVSPNVGSVTAPVSPGLAGLPVKLLYALAPIGSGSGTIVGGPFTASNGALTASVPALPAHTTFFVIASIASANTCQGDTQWTLGQFTTQ